MSHARYPSMDTAVASSLADDAESTQGQAPSTNIKLYLRATNLHKSITNQQPDTFARISWLNPTTAQLPPPALDIHRGEENDVDSSSLQVDEKTEVVHKSSNPRYTSSFSAQYEFGSQLLFFIDIFEVREKWTSGVGVGDDILESFVNKKRGLKHLGRAVFDVQDVLGSSKNVKARRLRKGGVVYAHIEQQSQSSTNNYASSPSRSLTSSVTSSATSSDSRILSLRLRADSLVHTHSLHSRVAPNTISKPDTYIEISRPSSSGTWIVVYRSPPVNESVSPMWDEAVLDLGSFHCATPASSPKSSMNKHLDNMPSSILSSLSFPEDLNAYRIMITIYKVKKRKCKEIGSLSTTVRSLVDACKTVLTGHDDGHASERKTMISEHEDELVPTEESPDWKGGEETYKFHLRPTPAGGKDPSDEITGNITVVTARIESSEEMWKRSQRELLSDVDENDAISEMTDYDSSAAASVNQVMPHPSQPKFNDYVRAGILDIDCCIAIDFTSSNGDPRIPGTQHYSRDGMMNDYEEAILAILSTIEKYSSGHYPVWGFGARYDGEVRHIFQCGTSPTAKGTEGVLDAYRTVFETDLIMSGPTVVNSVLRAAAARAKKYYKASTPKMTQYCVLLILTDGIVNDLQSTQELVRSYHELQLPLSVIVVGIGRADFSDFHEWDNAPLEVRGRFKFVQFRDNQFDPDTLSREALLRVPKDVVDYFGARNILPAT